MELYGEWAELTEVEQEEDPEITKQNILMERSGFQSVKSLTFCIKKHFSIKKHSKSSSFEEEQKINQNHRASLVQTQSQNDLEIEDVIIEKETKQTNINNLDAKFKDLLVSKEYPVQYGKEYTLDLDDGDNVILTVIMMKNCESTPMGIGWINNETEFEYDQSKNGVYCDFVYDAVPPLLSTDIYKEKGDGKKKNDQKSQKTHISEQELLKDFVPKSVFKDNYLFSLDPDVCDQIKNRTKRKQIAIDKYHQLKQLQIAMELKLTEQEIENEKSKLAELEKHKNEILNKKKIICSRNGLKV